MADQPSADTFVETNALLAVMDEDHGKLDELLDGMLPSELRQLVGYCHALGMAADTAADAKDRGAVAWW